MGNHSYFERLLSTVYHTVWLAANSIIQRKSFRRTMERIVLGTNSPATETTIYGYAASRRGHPTSTASLPGEHKIVPTSVPT